LAFAWRGGSASARHAIWALAIAGALLLPAAASVLPTFELPLLSFPPYKGGVPERINSSLDSEAGVVAHTETLIVSDEATPRLEGTATELLALVWSLGFLVVFGRFVAASVAVRRLIKHSIDVEDPQWRELIQDLRSQLSITKPTRLVFHEGSISPMTWGLFRHVILLSSKAQQWTPARRRLVLTHELAHVKRNDGLMQLGVQLACSVYWFNPLIWYAAHRLRLEREHACDDQVLNQGTNPEDYAGHLIEIARGLCHDATFTFAAISMAQPSQLETRVRSIINSKVSRRTLSRLAMAALLASIGVFTASVASVAITAAVPPPPVLAATPIPLPEPAAEKPAPPPPQRTRIGDPGTAPTAGVTPPRVVSSTQPPYTREAFTNRIEGTVTIDAAIDAGGNVRVLRTVKGLGYGLDENASRALTEWKFAPAVRNGVAVEAVTQVDVDFILANDLSMNGTVGGTVSGLGGTALIPGVSVTATEVATGLVFTQLTDKNGAYRFASLKPGTYSVTAAIPGYTPRTFNRAPLGAQQQVRLNFALEQQVQVSLYPQGKDVEVFKVGGNVRPPTVVQRVEPHYPEEARDERIQGTVVLGIVVRVDGDVEGVRVVRSLDPRLDESAVEAMKQWKFRPAMRDDTPVAVSLNVEVNFNLK
jgi:TonB family protein